MKTTCVFFIAIAVALVAVIGFSLFVLSRPKEGDDKIIKHLVTYIRVYWYIIIMAPITAYVIHKWPYVIRFEGLNTINGNNLIFIFWLGLLVLPVVKVKFRDTEIGFGSNPEEKKGEIKELLEKVNAAPVETPQNSSIKVVNVEKQEERGDE